MKKKILLGLLVIFVIAQFFQIDKENPKSDIQKDFFAMRQDVPEDITKMLKDACYDCHSHETVYPWYTYIVPVGQWVRGHVKHGRDKLNFSLWADYDEDERQELLLESAEEIEDNKMPLKSYTWTHGNAKLSDENKTKLIDWLSK